ncbi:MAG: hypothetical protein QOK31_755, partial [Solirubrobacteraceae bacterium]|nr:hypothetical protein [Solirubrobacteraceae bacterium]
KPREGRLTADGLVRPIRGARRLGMRFDLQRRAPGAARFATVPVGDPESDLGRWQTFPASSPWRVRERVKNIQRPGAYRMHVSFRWYGRHGTVLRHATSATRGCRVPDRRPNLRIVRVDVAQDPSDATRDVYDVRFENNGMAATPVNGSFALSLTFTPQDVRSHEVRKPLGGGRQRIVRFVGPRCNSAQPPAALIDADNTIAERDEQDNGFTVVCPTP